MKNNVLFNFWNSVIGNCFSFIDSQQVSLNDQTSSHGNSWSAVKNKPSYGLANIARTRVDRTFYKHAKSRLDGKNSYNEEETSFIDINNYRVKIFKFLMFNNRNWKYITLVIITHILEKFLYYLQLLYVTISLKYIRLKHNFSYLSIGYCLVQFF